MFVVDLLEFIADLLLFVMFCRGFVKQHPLNSHYQKVNFTLMNESTCRKGN